MSLSQKIENLIQERVAVLPIPMVGMNPNSVSMPVIDPKSFSGQAGLSPSVNKGCCDDCDRAETVENKQPTLRYQFVGKMPTGADKDLAHGYHHTAFMSKLQKMVAPLPIVNKPSGIEVVASPALKRGLMALAKRSGMKCNVMKEGHCN